MHAGTTQKADTKSKGGIRQISFKEAVSEALFEEMQRDSRVFLMGEDIRVFMGGGNFGTTPMEKFYKVFGPERVRDTPISESAFIGAGVTAALSGLKPVVELMHVDFLGVCFDQILNGAGKMRYILGPSAKIPLVIRTNIGGFFGIGATHSECLYSIFAHCPGLKVVVPSTPYDVKGLLKEAIRNNEDPVIFCEHKDLYRAKGPVPTEDYTIPFGLADIKREGTDVTVVATGAMVHRALNAARELQEEGVDVEVVDTRTLVPLDKQTILKSVKKTSRLVVVDEDYERCGFAPEIAAFVADEAFDYLDAPPKRVATPTVPIPANSKLEKVILPTEQRIVKTVREVIA